ncbi:MAG: hypothetical protein K2G24_03035, partial [Muribaculaceae bacterium]|nr:hypothetical protein [Muribaculaceae bacterium]
MNTPLRSASVAKHGTSFRPTDANEIAAYTHYLLMKGQQAGNMQFDGHDETAEERTIAAQSRSLNDAISRQLVKCREADTALLLDCYELTFHLGYRRMPDKAFVDRQKQRIYTAWKSGDRHIEESVIFGIVAAEIHRDREKASREY